MALKRNSTECHLKIPKVKKVSIKFLFLSFSKHKNFNLKSKLLILKDIISLAFHNILCPLKILL